MRVNTSRDKVAHLATEARLLGEGITEYLGSGNVRCVSPVELHAFGYPDRLSVDLGFEKDSNLSQRLLVRCRKCDGCLAHRGRLWTARAIDEVKTSRRTWMGTLTLSPDRQTWARYSALSVMERRQSEMTEDGIFQNTVKVIAPELTLFLKRLRKTARFRYLLVTEAHKSGLPHFHCLIHEYEAPISKRILESKWRFGFSHWRLVEPDSPKATGYVCKYLAKSALTRVRGSQEYGRGTIAAITERVLTATQVISEAQ